MRKMAEASTAFVSSAQSENMVSQQSSPGILVFSRSLQLQYVNRRAQELMRNISHAMRGSGSMAHYMRLLEFRDQIKKSLDDRLGANIWEPFEVRRVESECGQQLLLRGFGHPDRAAIDFSRIIIVLEEIRSAEKDRNQQVHARMMVPEMRTTAAAVLANS